MADAFSEMVFPVQTGELPESMGEDGTGFTMTFTVDALLVQPFTVAVTE